jgi:transcription termination factor Rho
VSNTDLLSGGDVDTRTNSNEAPDATGEQSSQANGAAAAPKKRAGGLSGMVIAELRQLAGELGITDTTGMRKGDLIAAIREKQGKTKRRTTATTGDKLPVEGVTEAKGTEPKAAEPKAAEPKATEPKAAEPKTAEPKAANGSATVEQAATETAAPKAGGRRGKAQPQGDGAQQAQQNDEGGRPSRRRRGSNRPAGSADSSPRDEESGADQRDRGDQQQRNDRGDQRDRGDQQQRNDRGEQRDRGDQQQRNDRGDQRDRGDQQQRNDRGDQRRQNDRQRNQQNQDRNNQQNQDDDDERGGRRGRRFRDRRRRGGRGEGGPDTEIREDDVLLPVAGILDVLDNYAFVRTSGYLPGPNDVYVSLSLVRKYGLRRGDAITGVVRQPREGEQQRQKFNPLVRVDSINGLEADAAKSRPEFTKLTPLYPNERLRLETESHKLTTRVIDLVMPVGKGQRALIVSPPKAGKTTIMQDIANAITTNNPECHLMVVLVDERPEEVTDMQRSVKGEVIASTFDRPPSDHTSVAELSIERAKRLVEMGLDVVVLLDSITRLGRAYNLAAPASGRILSGGVDSTALFPPKRFLGAARNIEGGGSLTIFATAMVETGSTGDTVIFEEFKGTGNAELKLDRKIAERRVFPAVDVNPSGTRKEELLLTPDELGVTHKLHRVLHALDSQQAIDLLLDRLRKTKTNTEFLMQVSKTAPGQDD